MDTDREVGEDVEIVIWLRHVVGAGALRQMCLSKKAGPPHPPLAGQWGPVSWLRAWFQSGMGSKMAQWKSAWGLVLKSPLQLLSLTTKDVSSQSAQAALTGNCRPRA